MSDPAAGSPAPTAPATPAGSQHTPAAPAASPPPPTTPSADDIRAQVRADLARELKEATGHDSIAALKAARDQAEQDKLKAQGEFQKLAETAVAERDQFRARFEAATVQTAILSAASGAIDPQVVCELLASRARVGSDGSVSVDGKPAADAVTALLKDKPYLAKPVAGQGSGAGSAGPGSAAALTRGAFEALGPAARMAHIKAGGTVVEG